MPSTIQIRHVPADVHRRLKARAALSGHSLSEYLARELRRVASQATPEEMRERLSGRRPVPVDVSPARAVRDERRR